MHKDPIDILTKANIRPTSNRILVLKAILSAKSPLSLIELESELQTIERSSISRVLNLLLENEVLHTMEDGRGIAKYELCCNNGHCSINDMHAHFYCEKCMKVYCFEKITTPDITLPENFVVNSVNFMLKGICPSCQQHK